MAQNTSSKPPRGCYSIYPSACFTCLFWCTERKPEQLSVPAAGPAAVPNAYHYFTQGSSRTKLGQSRTTTPQILITQQSLENWSAWLTRDTQFSALRRMLSFPAGTLLASHSSSPSKCLQNVSAYLQETFWPLN